MPFAGAFSPIGVNVYKGAKLILWELEFFDPSLHHYRLVNSAELNHNFGLCLGCLTMEMTFCLGIEDLECGIHIV